MPDALSFPAHGFSDADAFHLLMENVVDYAIFFTDPACRITSWNLGAERLLYFTEAEVLGQSSAVIFTPEDRRRGAPEQEHQEALRAGRSEDERWHIRRDNSRFWGSGIMTALRDEEGNLRGFAKILRDNTAKRRKKN